MGPAATLAILVKAQGVQATSAQLTTLDKTARKAGSGLTVAEGSAKRSSKTFSAMGSMAKSAGLLVGAAGLAAGVKVAIGEFREAQKVGAQTNAVLKSTGGAAKVTAAEIEKLSGAISRKAGIDDEAIQKGANLLLTFKDIRNEVGKGNDIFSQATQVITDMSVAMNQGLKPSAIQVGKALNDPVKGLSALGRVGVQFTEQQKTQVAALVASGDKLKAQKIILAELKSEFAGSAAAQATAADHFKVALNNLAESAGAVLVPAMDKATVALTKFLEQMQTGVGAGGAFADALRTLTRYWDLQIKGIRAVTDVLLSFFTTILDGIKALADLGSHLPVVGGKFRDLANRTEIATAKVNALREKIRPAGHEFDNLNTAADELGHSLASNFDKGRSGANALGHSITSVSTKFAGLQQAADAALSGLADAIKKPARALKPVGDGIGRQAALSIPGVGSAALMGANSSLSPFARIGAGFGLHVSSGRRPGSITSSGNTSYHSSGEAIDMAGSAGGMMATFKALRSKYGSRLAELIYTPGGVGIKDGRSHTYTGQVAADHFDHVHVAFDTGKPGVGDGIGKRVRAHLMGDGYGKTGLQALWTKAGGPAGAANLAAAVALAESGGQSTASHRNTDGSIDRGLWQINSVHGGLSTFNPLGNAKAAVKISGGGRNWNPWVAYTTGRYKKFLGKKTAAAKKVAAKAKKVKKPAVKNPKAAATKISYGSKGHTQNKELFDYQQDEKNRDLAHAAEVAAQVADEQIQRQQSIQDAQDAAAAEAQQKAMDALTEQLRLANEKLTLQTALAQETLRKYNVSQTDYGTLAKAIASVASGEIGGRVGLGFMSPGFAGGKARY